MVNALTAMGCSFKRESHALRTQVCDVRHRVVRAAVTDTSASGRYRNQYWFSNHIADRALSPVLGDKNLKTTDYPEPSSATAVKAPPMPAARPPSSRIENPDAQTVWQLTTMIARRKPLWHLDIFFQVALRFTFGRTSLPTKRILIITWYFSASQ